MSNTTANRILGSPCRLQLRRPGQRYQQHHPGFRPDRCRCTHLVLNNFGLIDANQSNSLTINPIEAVTNTGSLPPSAGGTLNLSATVNNSFGTILSTGDQLGREP